MIKQNAKVIIIIINKQFTSSVSISFVYYMKKISLSDI